MIIETNGLPGSGKTVLCDKLFRKLNKLGIKAVNVSRLEQNIIVHIYQKVIASILFCREMQRKDTIWNVVKKCERNEAVYASTIEAKAYIKRYLYLRWFYYKRRTDDKIYLFDEGIYQVLTALTVDFSLQDKELDELLKYAEDNALPDVAVMYNISIEKCLQSISLRNRQTCDIDKLEGKVLEQMLKEYQEVYSYFLKKLDRMFVIDRVDSLELNIAKIVEKIEGFV